MNSNVDIGEPVIPLSTDVSLLTPKEMFELQTRATADILSQIEAARKSPLGLYRLLFRQKNGQPVIIKDFHEEWNRLVLTEKRILIEAARGVTKTSFLIAYAAWAIGVNPNVRIKWVGPNDSNAEKRLSVIHELIDKPTSLYHVVFPGIIKTPKNDSKRPNTGAQLNIIRDVDTPEPTIEGVGVTSSGTGGRCLDPDTLLMASDGLIRAYDVEPGMRLLTHTGKMEIVKGRTVQLVDEDMITVQPMYSAWPITVTCDHKFLVRRHGNDGLVTDSWVRADELDITTDSLLHPRSPNNSTHKITSLPELQARIEKFVHTEGAFRLLGYYCAEGWLGDKHGKNGLGLRLRRSMHLGFSAKGNDDCSISDVETICKRLGLTVTKSPIRNNCVTLNVQADDALTYICQQFGDRANIKSIPTIVKRASLDAKRDFLVGYWRGDGSKAPVTGGYTYCFTTSSQTLAAQTWQMLIDCGVLSHISANNGEVRAAGSVLENGGRIDPNGPVYNVIAHREAAIFLDVERPSGELIYKKPQRGGYITPEWACIKIRSLDRAPSKHGIVIGISIPGPCSHAHPIGVTHNSDILILDDVCSHQNTILNPSMMPKVTDKVLSDWIPTVVADGQVVDLFTPWHRSDLNSTLKAQFVTGGRAGEHRAWAYSRHAHGKPGDDYYSIFPELWPSDALKEKRTQIGETLYAMAYLLKLESKVNSYVLASHLRVYDKVLAGCVIPQARCILSFDPASGKKLKSGTDFFGACVLLFHQWEQELDNRTVQRFLILVPEAFSVKLPTVYQTLLIWQMARQWNAEQILVEAKGMQTLDVWLQDQQEKNAAELGHYTIQPISFGNISKGERLQKTTPLLNPPGGEPPIVYFHPRVIERTAHPLPLNVLDTHFEMTRNLRHQLLDFPTAHDDTMDAFTQGMNWIQRNWMPVGNTDVEDREIISVSSISF